MSRPDARTLAIDALVRIDTGGAYANLLLPGLLGRSRLSERDRAFATDLVYGTTRRRRSCDWLVDRFLHDPAGIDPQTRAALRLGAYQLAVLGTPPHAAVSATVDAVPARRRGLVNAVLRKVAGSLPVTWPDLGTELGYPDWIVARLVEDLGAEAAEGALRAMDEPAAQTERDDGYTQDLASQWVAELVGAQPGERVADLAAAPGGKATLMARSAALVAASDLRPRRAELVAANAARLGLAGVATLVADGANPPYRPGSLDRVLLDAPCSGLGALRRRPDARWRIQPADVDELVALQRRLLGAAADLVRPGGTLAYSVCTLTVAESTAIDDWLAAERPDLEPVAPPPAPWEPWGRGALLLPQAAGTDGMALFRYNRAA